ncbi:MAG TPA: hypothetical protein VFA65_05590 [Bryobacteraceae bacterium]|nr:hypothetical protein [Bryobacteraceae bacterium]
MEVEVVQEARILGNSATSAHIEYSKIHILKDGRVYLISSRDSDAGSGFKLGKTIDVLKDRSYADTRALESNNFTKLAHSARLDNDTLSLSWEGSGTGKRDSTAFSRMSTIQVRVTGSNCQVILYNTTLVNPLASAESKLGRQLQCVVH